MQPTRAGKSCCRRKAITSGKSTSNQPMDAGGSSRNIRVETAAEVEHDCVRVAPDKGARPAVEHMGAHGNADGHVVAGIGRFRPAGEPPHEIGGKVIVEQESGNALSAALAWSVTSKVSRTP